MNIFINRKAFEVPEGSTLEEALALQGLDGAGYAAAIGNQVVRRADRAVTALTEGIEITVIKAVCGG